MGSIRRQTMVFTPKEIDFFAKDELVTIVPNFSLPTENSHCECIMGEFGPFQPNRECQVPLWMAITLWKRRKCSIKAPEWMDPDTLQTILELERQDPSSFQPLPFHYQEIAHTLFTAGDHASLPREVFGDNHQKIRDLVNLVQKTRYNKILQGLSTMQEAAVVKVNYLSAMELNAVRSFFTGALDQFHKYGKMGDMDAAVAGVVVNAGGATGTAAATAAAGEQQQPEQEQPLRQLRRDR